MGNIKLIGELYKKRMIAEKILHACVTDLLGAPSVEPPEENVEALCNLLVTVGKELESSPKLPKQMFEMYFARLAALAEEDSSLDSRVRFLCRDVIELRNANWVPRVKKLEAMTLSEIHAEAAAAPASRPRRRRRFYFRAGRAAWEVVGKNGKTGGGSSNNLASMGGGKQSSLSAVRRRRAPCHGTHGEGVSATRSSATRRAAIAGGARGAGDAGGVGRRRHDRRLDGRREGGREDQVPRDGVHAGC